MLEQGASLADRLERLLTAQGARSAGTQSTTAARVVDRIVIHDDDKGRLAFVDVPAIDWIEADGNYVRLHVGPRVYPLRTTMSRMEERVGSAAGASFIRIRRSALVNSQAITGLEPYGRGMFLIHVRNGAKLISSRYHQKGLRKLIGVGS